MIHNHIICNDVSFVDYKHIHINKKWYYNTRRISDRICREYGLSVITPSAERGKSYTEYTVAKNSTSWKAKLKNMIDVLIPQAKDFDDFLRLMQENGYEVKQGKYISFRAEGQERFTRAKTIGVNYTEEAIAERIAHKRTRKQPRRDDNSISLLIDIQNSIKAQQSGGYEHWAKINNLQQASKTINFLTENGIHTYEDTANSDCVCSITSSSSACSRSYSAESSSNRFSGIFPVAYDSYNFFMMRKKYPPNNRRNTRVKAELF